MEQTQTKTERGGWFGLTVYVVFCWYLEFFAPTWNVNSTVFSTEMQFSPSWFCLIKPDSWMFWCKSVIRGLWEGFEMKAKQFYPCSLCSYVWTLGLAFEKVHFHRFIAELCTEVQHVHQTLIHLFFKNGLACCLHSRVSLQPTFLSQQKWVRLGWNDTRSLV